MITDAQIQQAHNEATCQKGPRKGRLKATCPPMGTLGEAYWLGAMYALNPLRVSIARLIFMSPEHRELFDQAAAAAQDILKRQKAA